jgi:hypothetical protein
MSHFSKIHTKMVDKDLVLKALADMGFTAQEGDQQVIGFGGQKQAVDIRVPLKLSYDLGLRKTRGGFYEIVADWYGVRGLKQKEFTDKLSQRYAYHATRQKLEEQGFSMVEEQVEQTGQIRIVLRRMG